VDDDDVVLAIAVAIAGDALEAEDLNDELIILLAARDGCWACC